MIISVYSAAGAESSFHTIRKIGHKFTIFFG